MFAWCDCLRCLLGADHFPHSQSSFGTFLNRWSLCFKYMKGNWIGTCLNRELNSHAALKKNANLPLINAFHWRTLKKCILRVKLTSPEALLDQTKESSSPAFGFPQWPTHYLWEATSRRERVIPPAIASLQRGSEAILPLNLEVAHNHHDY